VLFRLGVPDYSALFDYPHGTILDYVSVKKTTLRQGSRGRAVPSFRTRREYVHVGSVATSVSLTVLNEGTAHPLLCAKAQTIGF